MTVLEAPPTDHSPRVASANIDDFAVPQGREEEWRYAPLADLSAFMQSDTDAGTLTAVEGAHVRNLGAAQPGTWLPTDRPSAVAWSGVRSVVSVRVDNDEIVDEPIVVTLTG